MGNVCHSNREQRKKCIEQSKSQCIKALSHHRIDERVVDKAVKKLWIMNDVTNGTVAGCELEVTIQRLLDRWQKTFAVPETSNRELHQLRIDIAKQHHFDERPMVYLEFKMYIFLTFIELAKIWDKRKNCTIKQNSDIKHSTKQYPTISQLVSSTHSTHTPHTKSILQAESRAWNRTKMNVTTSGAMARANTNRSSDSMQC
mmetsp:Transcript_4991/g.9202  ORF Transcript_4991/g.9202 Transcript_4991/m.9202 type:complete len:201 (-) Transcript_4991:225-827(-)